MPLSHNLICKGCSQNFNTLKRTGRYCNQKCYMINRPSNKTSFATGHPSHNKGKHLSYETRLKLSEIHRNKRINPTPEEALKFSKALEAMKKSVKKRNGPFKGQTRTLGKHTSMILNECQTLSEQGFRVIPTLYVIPDIIAIKDGKVYAVECETYGRPNYAKYEGILHYDDIIWIIAKKEIKRGE